MATIRRDPFAGEDFSKCGIRPVELDYIRGTINTLTPPLTDAELEGMKPGKIEVVPAPEWVRVTFKIVTERGNCIECEGKFVSDATFACLQELLRHQVKV